MSDDERAKDFFFTRNGITMLKMCVCVCVCFTGLEDPANYPQYILAIHSSKRLLVEQISPPAFVLADTLINLTLAKGQRHEVGVNFLLFFRRKFETYFY